MKLEIGEVYFLSSALSVVCGLEYSYDYHTINDSHVLILECYPARFNSHKSIKTYKTLTKNGVCYFDIFDSVISHFFVQIP